MYREQILFYVSHIILDRHQIFYSRVPRLFPLSSPIEGFFHDFLVSLLREKAEIHIYMCMKILTFSFRSYESLVRVFIESCILRFREI